MQSTSLRCVHITRIRSPLDFHSPTATSGPHKKLTCLLVYKCVSLKASRSPMLTVCPGFMILLGSFTLLGLDVFEFQPTCLRCVSLSESGALAAGLPIPSHTFTVNSAHQLRLSDGLLAALPKRKLPWQQPLPIASDHTRRHHMSPNAHRHIPGCSQIPSIRLGPEHVLSHIRHCHHSLPPLGSR